MIPCIECDINQLEYLISKLKLFGYGPEDWQYLYEHQTLILHGTYRGYNIRNPSLFFLYYRELINDPEKFLVRAAYLRNIVYKPIKKNTGFEGEKIPCIKCDQKLWDYIIPKLKSWNYVVKEIENLSAYPILTINYCNTLGDISSISSGDIERYNRELVTNPEEFLARAAKLKGFEYNKPNN